MIFQLSFTVLYAIGNSGEVFRGRALFFQATALLGICCGDYHPPGIQFSKLIFARPRVRSPLLTGSKFLFLQVLRCFSFLGVFLSFLGCFSPVAPPKNQASLLKTHGYTGGPPFLGGSAHERVSAWGRVRTADL